MEKRLEMPQLYAELEVSTGAVGDTDLGYRSQLWNIERRFVEKGW